MPLSFAFVWQASRVPIKHHRGQLRARIMYDVLRGKASVMPRSWPILAALAAVISVPNGAQARKKSTVVEERLIDSCIHRSARGKSWLEDALRALHRQEGGWIGAQVKNRDGSHDLGPMQINSWWVPRFARLLGRSADRVQQWLRMNACFNVEAARYLLLSELDRSGDIWIAVGRYHSPVWRRQRLYIAGVAAHLDGGVHPNR